jgi:hypothetical protein
MAEKGHRLMKAGSTLLGCVCAALLQLGAAHAGMAQTVVSISPPLKYTVVSTSFSLGVSIACVANLNLYHIVVTFDHARIRYDGVVCGTFLTGATILFSTPPGSDVSTVVVDESLIQQATQSGSGILFVINFTALQVGPAPVTIGASSTLRDGDNQSILFSAESGEVIVEAVVPVQLASFTAQALAGQCVSLEWQTLSETNNYGFEVQRSSHAEGASFVTIGGSFVPGQGTTLVPHQYGYIDSSAGGGAQYYRLLQLDLDGSVHASHSILIDNVTCVSETEPTSCLLLQNYPNPFNPVTTIGYRVSGAGYREVRLAVYDLLGREVTALVDEKKEPGSYEVRFDGSNLASGVYLYRLQTGEFVQTRRLLLMK